MSTWILMVLGEHMDLERRLKAEPPPDKTSIMCKGSFPQPVSARLHQVCVLFRTTHEGFFGSIARESSGKLGRCLHTCKASIHWPGCSLRVSVEILPEASGAGDKIRPPVILATSCTVNATPPSCMLQGARAVATTPLHLSAALRWRGRWDTGCTATRGHPRAFTG